MNWKRKLTICMVLIMMYMMGINSSAKDVSSVSENGTQESSETAYYINPLYEGVIQESDLTEVTDMTEQASYGIATIDDETEEYLSSVEEAGEIIKEAMKNREETILVYFQAEEYSKELLTEISDQGLVHTGEPTEGDYLKWQYGGWTTSTEYYTQDDICYMKITYTYTYYTTYEEELEVDQAVSDLIEELQVSEESDYEKVYAVYDYICQHTTYSDIEEDEDYLFKCTAYSALIDGDAVCQGYSLLFYRLMLELGVDNRLIAGTGNDESHGWNIVELDSLYYNGDTTWDAGKTEYIYFLKSEDNFADHVRYDEYTTEAFTDEYIMAQEDYVYVEEPEVEEPEVEEPEVEEPEVDAPEVEMPVIESVYSQVQTSAKVTWGKLDDVTGYEVWRSTDLDAAEDEWVRIKTIQGDDIDKYTRDDIIQYTNVDLEVGVTYYYKVCSFQVDVDDEANETYYYSEYSEISYMPAAVVFDIVYSNSTERIRLLWNEVESANGYQIWRMNEDGTYSIVKTLGDQGDVLTDDQGDTVAYGNTGLESGETYTYYMRAFVILDGKKVFGVFSDEITVGVMPETPDLSVEQVQSDRVTLTWESVNGASGYQIWRADSEDGEYTIVKSVTDGETTSYTNQGLSEGVTYYYKIRAYIEVDGKKTFGEFSEIQCNAEV